MMMMMMMWKGGLKKETEGLITAAHDQALRTNLNKAENDKQEVSPLCRMCLFVPANGYCVIAVLKRSSQRLENLQGFHHIICSVSLEGDVVAKCSGAGLNL